MKEKYRQAKSYFIMGILSLICAGAVLLAFFMNRNLHFSILTYAIVVLWICIAVRYFWYYVKARKKDLK